MRSVWHSLLLMGPCSILGITYFFLSSSNWRKYFKNLFGDKTFQHRFFFSICPFSLSWSSAVAYSKFSVIFPILPVTLKLLFKDSFLSHICCLSYWNVSIVSRPFSPFSLASKLTYSVVLCSPRKHLYFKITVLN